VAERFKKHREASTDREAGVVFRMKNKKENHPGCVCFGGASRNFFDDAATPPCGDARRGLLAPFQFVHSFYER